MNAQYQNKTKFIWIAQNQHAMQQTKCRVAHPFPVLIIPLPHVVAWTSAQQNHYSQYPSLLSAWLEAMFTTCHLRPSRSTSVFMASSPYICLDHAGLDLRYQRLYLKKNRENKQAELFYQDTKVVLSTCLKLKEQKKNKSYAHICQTCPCPFT